MKILVVDDEYIIRRLLSEVLNDWGHQVTVVDNGYEAVRMAKKTSFDIIFSDVHMPEMTGLEVVTLIRKFDQKVTIVMMDSYPDSLSELAKEKGAITCVHKPFDLDEIKEIIKGVKEGVYGREKVGVR